MIVKMKKVSLIVLDTFREESLKKLRKLGIVHLEANPGTSEKLTDLEEKKNQLERALLLLPLEEGSKEPGTQDLESCLEMAQKASEYTEKARTLQEEVERLQREAERLIPWGDFNPEEILSLKDKGIDIRLYELSPDQYKQFPRNISISILNRTKTAVRLAAVYLEPSDIPDLEEFPLPGWGLNQVRALILQKKEELKQIENELKNLARNRSQIQTGINELEGHIEFEKARAGMGVDEQLAYLTGYVPINKLDRVRKAASDNGWALVAEDPKEEDPVPTLVENPKWIQIIQPVFNLIGTVPGYREFDISFLFLLFFSLFFAILIGDAGYGLFFLIMTIAFRLKFRKSPSGPFLLLFVLSISTIIWGVLSGTWFGIEYLATGTDLSRLVIPAIASFGVDNADLIMLICFVIGAIHLSIAHIINLMRYLPRLRAFAELGWLSVVWGMFFFIRYIVLQMELNPIGLWLVMGGLALVVLFGEQKGKFFKGLLMGIAYSPLKMLDSIGAFSDIISYVRLFAVGLATVEVAKSFNSMAEGIGFVLPVGLISALILFLGHALNIAMGAMSVIVHGVRLNMLEFSGHLGMEWTGIPYEPFKTDRKEK